MEFRSPLLDKLDAFIRKYYRNRMIRGGLITLALVGSSWVLLAALEYWGRFGTGGRTFLFYAFFVSVGISLVWGVVVPALQWLRLGPRISYEAASQIIGQHFPEVGDRLLNTLQLQRAGGGDYGASEELLAASIAQRTEELRPIAFTAAIRLRDNVKYLRYALPPLALLGLAYLIQPEWVAAPTERILAHDRAFVAPAPFRFQLLNERLETPADQDFEVRMELVGNKWPSVVYVEMEEGGRFRMNPEGDAAQGRFTHRIPLVREDVRFRFSGGGFESEWFELQCLAVPGLATFKVSAQIPDYTGIADFERANNGDLSVPEGTRITWDIESRNTDAIALRLGDQTLDVEAIAGTRHRARWTATQSAFYELIPSNLALGAPDTLRYQIQVIPDLHPTIFVDEAQDSTSHLYRYFTGQTRDDYGFSRLEFVVKWLEVAPAGPADPLDMAALVAGLNPTAPGTVRRTALPVPSGREAPFLHAWDMGASGIRQGDVVEYWFEVWDNDGVHGAKSTRSQVRTYRPPSEDELREERAAANEAIDNDLEQALKDAQKLSEELEALKRRLREDQKVDWKDERALQEFLQRQAELQQQIEALRQANEQKNKRSEAFDKTEERIQQKQEQLQNLLDSMLSDEWKEMMEELQRLMEELDQEGIEPLQEQLDEMEVDQSALEKELDRALEQFRQLEWELDMEALTEDLADLAQKQKDLAAETEAGERPAEELKAEQDALQKEFEEAMERLEELEERNQELEEPNPMPDNQDQQQSIQQDMQQGSEQLEKQKNQKAAEKQRSAGQKMEQMAAQMQQMQMQMQSQSMEEDLDALRALLENLLTLSFEEENVMEALRNTAPNDPRFVQHGQTQRRLKDDARMVEDSLFALSKRIPQLSSAVNREIGLINRHMDRALAGFADRQSDAIAVDQQYVMTSFNNLALMLDEALKQMQQAMAQSQPGSGNCQKPGGNGSPSPSPSAGEIKRMQQALGAQLEKMKNQMGQGANQGNSPDQKRQLSKEWAELAAKQSALRRAAEKKASELSEDGSGMGEQMREIAREMEALERDLVNKKVDPQTLRRQQDLMVRLLEAENAERTQGQDDKRKSTSGDPNLRMPGGMMEQYLRQKERETELLRTIPPELVPFYRDRVNEYFNNLDGDDR
ncbi:MAG: hypothetical protein RJA19_36 [Bacteroidota bacterium]